MRLSLFAAGQKVVSSRARSRLAMNNNYFAFVIVVVCARAAGGVVVITVRVSHFECVCVCVMTDAKSTSVSCCRRRWCLFQVARAQCMNSLWLADASRSPSSSSAFALAPEGLLKSRVDGGVVVETK